MKSDLHVMREASTAPALVLAGLEGGPVVQPARVPQLPGKRILRSNCKKNHEKKQKRRRKKEVIEARRRKTVNFVTMSFKI